MVGMVALGFGLVKILISGWARVGLRVGLQRGVRVGLGVGLWVGFGLGFGLFPAWGLGWALVWASGWAKTKPIEFCAGARFRLLPNVRARFRFESFPKQTDR